MSDRIPVAVLGATGVVGQRFVRRLAGHPRFELRHLAASPQRVGQRYRDACQWRLDGPEYAGFQDLVMAPAEPDHAGAPIVFSALDAPVAREVEPRFAAAGSLVFSNASAFRMAEDVPLVVPEVNGSHLGLLAHQRKARGWTGGIACNPNCTTAILTMALAPLHRVFGIEALNMVSMQAISGAGYPGVPSLDILGNVVPWIAGEEDKVEVESQRILGALRDGRAVGPAEFAMSAHCNRVPVREGHTCSVSIRLAGDPDPAAVATALNDWRGEGMSGDLPSAPPVPLRVHDSMGRPQALRDVEQDQGMSVHVGQIRRCPVMGVKFTVLGHNTERGAAGGSLLNAEYLLQAWPDALG